MQTISTEHAPSPSGHYAQAIVHDGLIYVSGQLPIDPGSGERVGKAIEDQARRVLQNLAAVLQAGGSGLDHVLKTTVYIADMSLWGRVNAVYAEHFRSHRPARSVVPTRELHYDVLIEIDAIAVVP